MPIFTVGYVGNLVHRKGVKYLIQGIHKLVPKYNLQLRVVGDGPLKMELQALRSELSLNKSVSFEGALDKKLIPDFLRSIDVLVLPSLSEGMPTVVLEAMACGKAVIATDVGATRTVIDSPDVGILVPPQDPLAIKEALEQLMTDEPLRMQMGKNARTKILSNYSWDVIVPMVEEVYLKVIKNG
jgi:glycosyltransferase involved in cell wall biosynthesis